MKKLISMLCLTTLLATAGAAAAAQVSFGIRIGPPPRPNVVRVVPRRPGPQYMWVQGYWYPVRGRYVWHEGYWTIPPYANARWVEPRYSDNQYFEGYWEGDRGRFNHDHRFDRDRDRDGWRWDRDHDRDRDRDHDRDNDRDRDRDRDRRF